MTNSSHISTIDNNIEEAYSEIFTQYPALRQYCDKYDWTILLFVSPKHSFDDLAKRAQHALDTNSRVTLLVHDKEITV